MIDVLNFGQVNSITLGFLVLSENGCVGCGEHVCKMQMQVSWFWSLSYFFDMGGGGEKRKIL